MRNRLIELIEEASQIWDERPLGSFDEICADHLLANGVIVPPVRVGDRLYQIVKLPRHTFVSEYPIIAEPQQIIYINILGNHSCIPFEDIGKTVFLSREDAEQALKGGDGE